MIAAARPRFQFELGQQQTRRTTSAMGGDVATATHREWSQTFTKVCGIICPSRTVQEYPMAPRANWKGYLRLSLVSCPIALYPASSLSEKVSFNRINRKTGNRLKQQNVDSETGEVVSRDDTVRGSSICQILRYELVRPILFRSVQWRRSASASGCPSLPPRLIPLAVRHRGMAALLDP